MRVTNVCLTALATAITLSACTSSPAPRRWLAPARDAQEDPYGAWIVLHGTAETVRTSGELLAVHNDSVFVLNAYGRVESVARSAALAATIAYYDSEYGRTAAWVGAGTLGSLAHGVGFLVSGPVWVIAGSLAARADSRAPLIQLATPAAWATAHTYARFPGGLPAQLPRVLPVKPGRRS